MMALATIDSIQGGERDAVIALFVRSNSVGDIGFVDDMHRLTVSISRSAKVMTLIGDFSGTLAKAKNPMRYFSNMDARQKRRYDRKEESVRIARSKFAQMIEFARAFPVRLLAKADLLKERILWLLLVTTGLWLGDALPFINLFDGGALWPHAPPITEAALDTMNTASLTLLGTILPLTVKNFLRHAINQEHSSYPSGTTSSSAASLQTPSSSSPVRHDLIVAKGRSLSKDNLAKLDELIKNIYREREDKGSYAPFNTSFGPFEGADIDDVVKVLNRLPFHRGMKGVGLGSGDGRVEFLLAAREIEMTGIEGDQQLIKTAWSVEKNLRGTGLPAIQWVKGDFLRQDLSLYDVVFYSLYSTLTLGDQDALWRKLQKEMRPGSVLIVYHASRRPRPCKARPREQTSSRKVHAGRSGEL